VKLIYGLQTIIDRDKSRANDKYAEFVEKVQIESALGILSGHTGFDFSTLGLDDNVVDADVQGIRGLFDAILEAKDGAPVTVREAAQIYGVSMGAPVAVGTPADVADQMEHYLDDGGCNGFMLLATDTPGCFNDVTELLVPELQRRGRYRTRYPGTTLRESLQEY
jgi:alkanesulfonate monooxygenase SsuD/methylene tetrahydromethanopterin reductase-like flavin-dependent oxidoreductase (luciferase family)